MAKLNGKDILFSPQITIESAVDSVNGKTGVVVLDADDVGAVAKEEGKGLSTNDFTNYYKNKIGDKEETSNKVTSISASSTDTQYPSAKCVYDIVGNIETALDTVNDTLEGML